VHTALDVIQTASVPMINTLLRAPLMLPSLSLGTYSRDQLLVISRRASMALSKVLPVARAIVMRGLPATT